MKRLLGEIWQNLRKSGKQDAAAKQTSVCADKRLSAVCNGVPLSYLASLVLILNEIMASFYRAYEEQCLVLQMFISLCCKVDFFCSAPLHAKGSDRKSIKIIALRLVHVCQ